MTDIAKRAPHRLAVVFVVALALAALASGAWAQPDDGDGYPLDVDERVVVRDDVVDAQPDAPPPPVDVEPAEVMGVALAVTGTQVALLLAAGVSLALLGGVLLVGARRRRTAAGHTG